MRPRTRRQGFTLVELLVVIAIIGILAGFLAVGLPKAMEMARLSALKNNMNQVRTILTAYYADHQTFPPSYGELSPLFLKYPEFANPVDRPDNIVGWSGIGQSDIFFLQPWMSFLREHGNTKLYDTFSRNSGYDTDGDGELSRLEFAMIGVYNGATQKYDFSSRDELWLGKDGGNSGGTLDDANEQLSSKGPRPFVYIAVNQRQARIFRTIIYAFASRPGSEYPNKSVDNPRPYNLDQVAKDAIRAQLSFPPPSYDAYVLVSVGPQFDNGTSGLLAEVQEMGFDPTADNYAYVNQYHLAGLAAYFMLSRDANEGGKGNGELDFDYNARKGGEAGNANNDLRGKYPKGAGPVIYVGGN